MINLTYADAQMPAGINELSASGRACVTSMESAA